jgi:hypothetical protein
MSPNEISTTSHSLHHKQEKCMIEHRVLSVSERTLIAAGRGGLCAHVYENIVVAADD